MREKPPWQKDSPTHHPRGGGEAAMVRPRPASDDALSDQRISDRAERRRLWAVRLCRHDWSTAIAGLADRAVERNRAKERHADARGLALGPAMAEDVFLMPAIRADMCGHVLDQAKHGRARLLEHIKRFAHIEQGNILRGRDDN